MIPSVSIFFNFVSFFYFDSVLFFHSAISLFPSLPSFSRRIFSLVGLLAIELLVIAACNFYLYVLGCLYLFLYFAAGSASLCANSILSGLSVLILKTSTRYCILLLVSVKYFFGFDYLFSLCHDRR